MKFRIITSLLAIVVAFALYIVTGGDTGTSSSSSEAPASSNSSDFGADAVNSMRQ